MQSSPGRGTAIILGISMAMLAIAMDPIAPSLPGIRAEFGIDVAGAQLAMSGLVVGFAFAQIVLGPLSDRIGRRPVLIGGWITFVIASIACGFAPTIETLTAARVLQAIGCCAAVVVGRATVRDLYGLGHAARMLGIIMSIGAIPIFLGPSIGGVVEEYLGWRWNFAWLALLGCAMLFATLRLLPESHHHHDRNATDALRILANYRTLIVDPRFVGHAAASVGNFSMIFSFLSGAGFVMITVLGYSPSATGVAIGAGTLGFALTSLAASRLVTRYGTTALLTTGAWIVFLAGTVMALLALSGVRALSALLVPYYAIMIGVGFINSSAVAGAIGPFPRIAGTASSLLGLAQFTIGGMIGYLASRFHDGTPVPMTIAVAGSAWMIFIAVYGVVRRLPPAEAGDTVSAPQRRA